MTVGRICTREVYLVERNESAAEAARRMARNNAGTLVSVDEDRRPLGIITDRDLILQVMATGSDPEGTLIEELVDQHVRSVEEATPIEEALDVMRSGPFRRLPVVDVDGRLVGILSLDDILELIGEECEAIGKILRKQAEPPMTRLGLRRHVPAAGA